MKSTNYLTGFLVLLAFALIMTSCSQSSGNETGHEYMPDMAHSVAYEAMTHNYYRQNTWGTDEELMEFSKPRKPVAGTIARGNQTKPYYYNDTEEDRAAATADPDLTNPFPITEKGLAQGKELYTIYCAVCHGAKGEAGGVIVENGAYPAQPSSYLSDEFISAADGRYYHAIMHGKNMMGNYADKLSYEERWQVIHYIRSMQAKSQGREYLPVATPTAAPVNKAPVSAGLSALTEMISSGGGSIALKNVKFRTSSATLKSSSYTELDGLASILTENANIKLRVGGHTDSIGDPAKNKTLSEARAASVLNYLTGKGIDASRLESVGYGADSPVASNDTSEGRAENRRTEVEIIN